MIDKLHPANWPALNYFNIGHSDGIEIYPLGAIPDHIAEAYCECGSHPDIVARVWDELGQTMPPDACCIVNGTNCLVQDQTGILLVVCMGTEYVLRIPEECFDDAISQGLMQTSDWGGIGRFTDLREEFGPNWFFGAFADKEIEWVQLSYKNFAERQP